MPKRTTPSAAQFIDRADDLEDLVEDKRAGWRASGAKARRRQRRYKTLLTRHLVDGLRSSSHGALQSTDDDADVC